MEFTRFLSFSTFVFVVLLLLHVNPCASQEVEDESEFSYQMASHVGPQHWGSIHKEWAACGNGKMQSPIDMLDEKVVVLRTLGQLRRRYVPAPAILVNRGHDIMLKWETGAGSFILNGTEYTLKQLHWHSPSEHTLNGKQYALELHMVHESADKKIAVLGVLYNLGRPEPFLQELEPHIRGIADMHHEEEKVGSLDPSHVNLGNGKYYRYMGSLTIPPCTEGVVWTLIEQVGTVSEEQLKLLRDAVHDYSKKNARPTQATNARDVHLYQPSDKKA